MPLQVILPTGGVRAAAETAGPIRGGIGAPGPGPHLADSDLAAEMPLPTAAVFDLVDFELDGEYIRMRAVDDLAGCGSALAAMARLVRSGQPAEGDVYALFTRAEEVGLVGARLAAENRLLPPATLVISVESSRTLPGAEQGRGPVIRVGDAGSTFDADAESVLIRAREALTEREGGFAAQRQLMSGGVCEARRVRGLRVPRHWHRLPARQLPQRRSRRPHRGRVHPRRGLPGRGGPDGGSGPPRCRPDEHRLPPPLAVSSR